MNIMNKTTGIILFYILIAIILFVVKFFEEKPLLLTGTSKATIFDVQSHTSYLMKRSSIRKDRQVTFKSSIYNSDGQWISSSSFVGLIADRYFVEEQDEVVFIDSVGIQLTEFKISETNIPSSFIDNYAFLPSKNILDVDLIVVYTNYDVACLVSKLTVVFSGCYEINRNMRAKSGAL
ncbi:hypothetical protein [Vibrio cyclitrophicus]